MKYVALLRGINVGGKNLISMAELKKVFEKLGFTNIITYINSGNVIFETLESPETTRNRIEKELSNAFTYDASIVIRSHPQLKEIVENVSNSWKSDKNDLRCYVAFVKEPVTPKEVAKEIDAKENVDFVKVGKTVIYLSTKLSGLTQSGFTKLNTKKVYKEITIRNFSTAEKLLELMEKH